jgi:hypothetical protein
MGLVSGGATGWFNDAVSGTVVPVTQNGPVSIYGLKLVNTTASAAYLQLFNTPASVVTLGTTVPTFVIRLGSNESVWLPMTVPLAISAAGNPLTVTANGINGTGGGLSLAGTTTSTGSTGAAISVSLFYI